MKTVASLVGLVLCALPAVADLPDMKTRGTLRVIAAADEQPETFSFKAGTEPGFEREMIEGFARLQGMKVEAVSAKTYADRIPMLNAGDGDLIIAIFVTDERRKLIDFSTEVMPTHNVVVTLSGNPPVTKLEDLRGLKVGVVKGTASVDDSIAAGVPAASLVKLEDGEAAIAALRAGAVTATVRPYSEFALSAKREKGLQAGMVVGPPGTSAWGIRKEDVQLRRALDDYIVNSHRAATWNRLLVKYFGDQALGVLGRKP
jgi:ABC-type amino acid transport substrate-binding protein